MTPTLIPISEPDGLYLTSCGHADDLRFRGVFSDTWRRIPPGDRAKLGRLWETYGEPTIEIVDDPPTSADAPQRDGDAWGGCYRSGTLLQFWGAAVEQLPDDLLARLIAHELAHAVMCHDGGDFATVGDSEAAVDRISAAWGLAAAPLERWAAENRIAQNPNA